MLIRNLLALLVLVGCAHAPPRGEQQEMGVIVWLETSDEMDADYANQAADYITALEQALELRTQQRDFWFSNYEELSGNNYAEAKAEEDHQVELIMGGCCDE